MTKWPTTKLGSVVQRAARAERPIPGKSYRQIGVKLWGEGAYERETMDGSQTKYAELFRTESGDIIVNKIWARNGSVAVVQETEAGCYGSSEFPMFAPNPEELDSRWIHWLTKTPGFWAQCDEKSRGTSGKNRIRPEQFLSVEIPLPSLAEQRRVVARIDELAAQIHEARTLRERTAREAEALFSNSRERIFSRLEAKADIPKPDLGQVTRFHTGYAFKSSDYRPSGRWIFRVSNIRADGSIDRTESVFLAEELESSYEDYQLKVGDILMVMVGGSVGKLCIIPESALPALMNQNMWRINPTDPATLSSEFLFHFLHRCNRTLGVGLTQSTHGHLTQTTYKTQKIPFPPLREQRRVVAELDALQSEVDALKRLQTETAAELDALLPAILDKAFKGEL